MSYDFFAAKRELGRNVRDLYAQIQLLAGDLPDESTKEQHQRLFQGQYNNYIQNRLRQFDPLLANNLSTAIAMLPGGTTTLQFKMQLARPFLSKDDAPYHICDNPLRKERVFRVPMMSATGWKGALRATAARLLALKVKELDPPAFAQKRFWLTRLFGNEKGLEDTSAKAYLDHVGGAEAAQVYRTLLAQQTETGFLAGRLRFYPSFFDKVAIEVINPHDRDKKAGKWPVYFESADIGATGTFTLLYVPFDLIGLPQQKVHGEIAANLVVLGLALQAMLTQYGFGAKTSSGFGVIENRLAEPGQLVLKAAGLPPESPAEQKPVRPRPGKKLRRYWKAENQLKDEFLTSEGEFVSEEQYAAYLESLGRKYAKSDRQLYKKAKGWWKRESKPLTEQKAEELEQEIEPDETKPQWAERTFTSLGEMVEKMNRLADALAAKEEKE